MASMVDIDFGGLSTALPRAKSGKLRPMVERLHGAIDATIRSPDIARTFVEPGADPQFGSPSECAGCVADDLAKWAGWPARPA